MKELQERLNRAGYICDTRFAASVKAALNTKPVAGAFLFGPIGTGKSYLPEILSGIIDADYFFYQCFPGTREDDLLVKMLPSEETISGIALHDGVMLQAVSATKNTDNDRKVILVLDEWDKTRPSADSFLLDFLQTGRINFSGKVYTADLSRLIVFLTLNIEREMSEPLLRRLPKIDFQALPPSLVHQALLLTHRNHPFLYNAVVLYERCLMANLPKPATIQELRQFLDAVTSLGSKADWDSLVYQFVTKTEENHELLRRAEGDKSRWKQSYRQRLDINAYGVKESDISMAGPAPYELAMPSLSRARAFDVTIPTDGGQPDLSKVSGILELNYSSYNEVVRLLGEPAETPDRLGDLALVNGQFITFTKVLPLGSVDSLSGLWGENGEVLLVEPLATWQDVKALQKWAHIKIVKFSKSEILAKADGIDLRWTPENGAEIIVDLAKRHVFEHCFGESWGRRSEEKWIGEKGLIYLRYKARQLEEDGQEAVNGHSYADVEADRWGTGAWDWQEDQNVPLLPEFLGEKFNLSRSESWKHFDFPGLQISFKNTGNKVNDRLHVIITGKFDAGLVRYLKAWLPDGTLPFAYAFDTEIQENALLQQHGFALSPLDTRISLRETDGFKLTYNPARKAVTVHKTITSEQLTKENIDGVIDRMRAFKQELGC